MKFKRTLKAIGYCIINLMLGFINPNSSFAQGIINNGANIVLSTNSKIYIDGSSIATGNYTSQSNGLIVNSTGTSEIFLTGNWVNKALTNTGFSNGNTTVNFIGATDQTIGGTTGNLSTNTTAFESIKCSGGGLKVFTEKPATIRATATIVSGTKAKSVDGALTLLSTATTTASLIGPTGTGPLTAATYYITGDVSVQSWFTGGVATPGVNYRRTRFLSSPINDQVANSLVKTTYQQLQINMYITGTGGSSNLFDNSTSTAPSIQTYNETLHPSVYSYSSIPNLTSATTTDPGKGFVLFYRGNRTEPGGGVFKLVSPFADPESQAYTYQGTVNQGDITVGSSYLTKTNHTYTYPSGAMPSDGYNLVGNPYPSTIDFTKITLNNVANSFYLIRPTGGFTGMVLGSSYNGAGGTNYIQPGQGFFVVVTGASPSITFTESCKIGTIYPMRLLSMPDDKTISATKASSHYTSLSNETSSLPKILRINLEDEYNIDETLITFKAGSKASYDVKEDAGYMGGSSVSLSSLSSEENSLLYNGLPSLSDTTQIKLNVSSTIAAPNTSKSVKLNFTDLAAVGNYQIFLKDNLLNTVTDVKANRSYAFTIDKANAETFGVNRFVLVFKPPIPVQVISFTAKVNNGAELKWTTTHEENNDYYEIERSLDGITFTKLDKINGEGRFSGNANYLYLDKDPANGVIYYRLKQVDLEGKTRYSELVSLTYTLNNLGNIEAGNIIVYPNPAQDLLNVDIPNRGLKLIRLNIFNLQGKKIKSKVLGSNDKLQTGVNELIEGVYIIEVVDESTIELIGRRKFIKVL